MITPDFEIEAHRKQYQISHPQTKQSNLLQSEKSIFARAFKFLSPEKGIDYLQSP